MTFTVLDGQTAFREVLTSPLQHREEIARPFLERAAGMYRYFPGETDVIEMHHLSSGFRLDAEDDRYLPALDAMVEANVWGRVESALHQALAVQVEATPDITVPEEITVLLVLGNPDDEHFMNDSLAMVASGSVTGYLWINIWPTAQNLEQIEAIAVHELHHNLRYANRVWDPATVTVGEHIVAEGLADAFARQLYGDLGYARIGLATLDDDEVFAKVLTGLDVTGMENFTAWVLGDTHAARYGGEPVGLPTGAGYSAGNRLVDAYLAAEGLTADQALLADREDVIAATLG
ncbi:MAG TPA: DUF2268 domain-containing putative Zn-dependent protease [Beutenbergiaceae bacterium]|nr:DUF2268 domain-containing putative Zn-dependent protease [Beutenbergiaceae bacterium]